MNFLALLSLPLLVAATLPVGIRNLSNYCYISSVLQVLFRFPSFRTAILNDPNLNEASLMLSSVFYKLATSKSAISLHHDFAPVVKNMAANHIQVGEQDDAAAFFQWIIQQVPAASTQFLKMSIEDIYFYQNIRISTQTIESPMVSFPVLSHRDIPVHRGLDHFRQDDLVEFKYRPSENNALRVLGINEERDLLLNTEMSVKNDPPVITISPQIAKYVNGVFMGWDTEVKVLYEQSFNHRGQKYVLFASVNYLPGHYISYVRKNAANSWYEFDDSTVSLKHSYRPRGQPLLLFYVKEGLVNEFVAGNENIDVSGVPERSRLLAATFDLMENSIHALVNVLQNNRN